MKLVRWSFHNLHIPMLDVPDVGLCFTAKTLADALLVREAHVRQTIYRYHERVQPLSVGEVRAQAFLRENAAAFCILRVKEDMHLLPFRAALAVAFHTTTERAWEFHQAVLDTLYPNTKGLRLVR